MSEAFWLALSTGLWIMGSLLLIDIFLPRTSYFGMHYRWQALQGSVGSTCNYLAFAFVDHLVWKESLLFKVSYYMSGLSAVVCFSVFCCGYYQARKKE